MRITEVSVKGLYGVFDHRVPLTNSDGVTVLHGPNGIGKTMLLAMIRGVVDGKPGFFDNIPFAEFSVLRDDGAKLTIRSSRTKGRREKNRPPFDVVFQDPTGFYQEIEGDHLNVSDDLLDELDSHISYVYRRSGRGWVARDNPREISLYEMLLMYPALEENLPEGFKGNIFGFFTEGLKTFYVGTSRLAADRAPDKELYSFDEADDSETLRVRQYSKEMAARIQGALADYAKKSQDLDRTFPQRLMKFVSGHGAPLSSDQIIGELKKLEVTRKKLTKLGFLESENVLTVVGNEDFSRCSDALTIYVNDMAEKFAALDAITQSVEKLLTIINNRFIYKSLSLHREEGFKFNSITGKPIGPESLSSGEQHELVLLYELMFRVPKNSLILIDEPEISLHAAWQASFLGDLMSVLSSTGSYGIIATHSPILIGARWDLTVELKGPLIPVSEQEL